MRPLLYALLLGGAALALGAAIGDAQRAASSHDPSTIVECDGTFWIYATGRGLRTLSSRDLSHWERGPAALPAPPQWVAREVPEYQQGSDMWAPDLLHVGDRFFLYYSVSVFGKNTSAIGLATNRTLDPASTSYKWEDTGPVVVSRRGDDFNAIDPSVLVDGDRMWMAFGSFWSGIQLIELDPETGLRRASTPMVNLAKKRQIEAACLHRRDSYYYLFVNWGLCCRGVKSTYEIRVGRSDKVTGPYVDAEGKLMLDGGGTLVLAGQSPVFGPGHAGITAALGREWLSFHYYDGAKNGRATLGLRPLSWDAAGWPVAGETPAN